MTSIPKTETAITSVAEQWPQWVFFLLPIFYISMYAPYGAESNDTGFILGYAWQIITGSQLYSDIIYIRPPTSPVFHTLAFAIFDAPIFVSRAIFFLQIFAYSWATISLTKNLFPNKPIVYLLGCLGFVFSAHNFPPMAWHTVDGIFFSIMGIFILSHTAKVSSPLNIITAACLALAFLSKQSFYLIPPAVIIYLLAIGKRQQAIAITTYLTVLLGTFILYLQTNNLTDAYLQQTSGQTSFFDLLNIGFVEYARDIYHGYYLIPFIPLLFLKQPSLTKEIKFSLCTIILTAFIFLKYFIKDVYCTPDVPLDFAFIASSIYCAWLFLTQRNNSIYLLILLHFVAWSASISWGYKSTALYATPAFLMLGMAYLSHIKNISPINSLSFFLTLTLAISVFHFAYRYPYNLEYKAERQNMTKDLSEIFPRFKFIKGDEYTYNLYKEFKTLTETYGNNFTVLPSLTLAHLLVGNKNPIGSDWLMNAEINDQTDLLIHRLEQNNIIVFYLKKTEPRPDTEGKYGSLVTLHIINNWEKIAEYQFFDVYKIRVQQ